MMIIIKEDYNEEYYKKKIFMKIIMKKDYYKGRLL